MTDDVVFSDLAAPADRVGKKEVSKANEEMFKGFPDSKIEQTAAWAAGDYVISTGRFSGTNTGDMPRMKLKKTGKAVNVEYYMVTKLAGGKVKNNWLFSNGMAFAGQLGMLPPPKAAPAKPAAKDTKAPLRRRLLPRARTPRPGDACDARRAKTRKAATPATPATARRQGAQGVRRRRRRRPMAPATPAAPAAAPKDAKPATPAAPATPATPATPAPPRSSERCRRTTRPRLRRRRRSGPFAMLPQLGFS